MQGSFSTRPFGAIVSFSGDRQSDVIESCDIDQKSSESARGENRDKSEADHSAEHQNHCQSSEIQRENGESKDETNEESREDEDQTPPGTLIIESTGKKCTTDLPCDMSQNSNRNSVELKVN